MEEVLRCMICHMAMVAVEYEQVPTDVVKEHRRLFGGKLAKLAEEGWYWCPECDSWTHLPTVMMMREMSRG